MGGRLSFDRLKRVYFLSLKTCSSPPPLPPPPDSIAICFLMSGLEADLKAMGRIGPVALRLLLIPGIVEGLVSAGVASAVFGMTGGTGALFALSLGWLLKPCDPSIGEGREGERGGACPRWGAGRHTEGSTTPPPLPLPPPHS